MAIEIVVQPSLPYVIVSDNPSEISPNLSNYATLSNLNSASGSLNETIIRSGSYLYNLINTSAAGVSSLNGASGILTIRGTGNVYVTTAGQIITISGEGGAAQSINLGGLISTGSADLRYLSSGSSGYFYPWSNPNQFSKSGELQLTGTSLQNQIFNISNNTGNFINASNLYGLISTGAGDLRYYPLSENPSGYLNTLSGLSIQYVLDVSGALSLRLAETGRILDNRITSLSGYLNNNFATVNYVNFISGELASQIQAGGGGSGVIFLNSLAGTINLISSTDTFLFNNTGNNINIWNKEQNSEIYRNASGQITGVKYNADFSRIYRDVGDKITGIFYNNYYKKILYNGDNNVTGVGVVYY